MKLESIALHYGYNSDENDTIYVCRHEECDTPMDLTIRNR